MHTHSVRWTIAIEMWLCIFFLLQITFFFLVVVVIIECEHISAIYSIKINFKTSFSAHGLMHIYLCSECWQFHLTKRRFCAAAFVLWTRLSFKETRDILTWPRVQYMIFCASKIAIVNRSDDDGLKYRFKQWLDHFMQLSFIFFLWRKYFVVTSFSSLISRTWFAWTANTLTMARYVLFFFSQIFSYSIHLHTFMDYVVVGMHVSLHLQSRASKEELSEIMVS